MIASASPIGWIVFVSSSYSISTPYNISSNVSLGTQTNSGGQTSSLYTVPSGFPNISRPTPLGSPIVPYNSSCASTTCFIIDLA